MTAPLQKREAALDRPGTWNRTKIGKTFIVIGSQAADLDWIP
jgi:hypothetical protein